jgi:hypothetical protein
MKDRHLRVGDLVQWKSKPACKGTIERVGTMTISVLVPGDFGIYTVESLPRFWKPAKGLK